MSFDDVRQWANNHPVACAAPILLVIVVAIYAGVHRSGGPTPVAYDLKLYYYDEDSGETVIRTDKDIPPLLNAQGKRSLVRATYMTAGDSSQKTLVYLMKYTDEAKAALDEEVRKKGFLDALTARGYEGGCLIRKPAPGSPWVPASSAEGLAIVNSFQLENKTPVHFCNP
jgi:hypothetical protein